MASIQPNFYFPYPLNPPPSPFHPFNPPPPHSFKSPPPSPLSPPSHSFPPPPPHGHPPPPPSHTFSPPPPHARPPPSHPFSPPPPHAHPPPSPHHPISPPLPPHVRPPPPSSPPSPSPYHPTVIIIVIISFGGIALLSMLAFALFCCIQKRKKKTQGTDMVHIDEHKKVTETIVPGPFGKPTVIISVEDDVHVDEVIKKNEAVGHVLHAEASKAESSQDNITSSNESATTTTSPGREHHGIYP